MRVLQAKERSRVSLNTADMVTETGALALRQDLIGKGLVEVRQSGDVLSLQINGVVGRLPVTDKIVLDVQPKFPVSNLNRLVYLSGESLNNPFGDHRPYSSIRTRDYLPVPLIRSYSNQLSRVMSSGLPKDYLRTENSEALKPKINFIRSYQKHWSKLQPTKAVVERFEFNSDTLENQCLKFAARKAMAIARSTHQLSEIVPELAQALRQMERISDCSAGELLRSTQTMKARRLRDRPQFSTAVEQALEIVRHVDVSLKTSVSGFSLESFLINLDNAFEGYIRHTLSSLEDVGFGRVSTVDGNLKRHQRKLFADNKKYDMKPDLIVKDSRGVVLIGDVKYKIKPTEEDRYQIITHCMGYRSRKALLIYPKQPSQAVSGLVRLGIVGSQEFGVEVYEYYFDLEKDMEQS